MSDVDENMDELFRKAAERYMVNEGESNWTKISGQLQSFISPIGTVNKNHAMRKYIIAGGLLLLCFSAGIIVHRYTSKENTSPTVAIKRSNNNGPRNRENESAFPLTEKKLQQDKTTSDRYSNKAVSTLISNTNIIPETTSLALIKGYSIHKPYSSRKTVIEPAVADLSISPLTKDKPAYTMIAVDQFSINKSNEATSLITLNSNNKRSIYYGILVGAGFTTVKSQSFTKPGFDAGFVAGYQSTPRSSVEINLIFSRKYYYSAGDYFNMDKMGDMPANMKLMSLKGSSSIFEIPVKFKYKIIQKKNNTFYAAAGVSSYVLVNEKNDYVTSTNGTMGKMNGNYTTITGYFAGALNINAGYEHTIGKNTTIRFEPYITIPTRGIGIGNLPVTTSGVHILFTLAPGK